MATQEHTLYPDRFVEISDKSGSYLVTHGIAHFTEQATAPGVTAPISLKPGRNKDGVVKISSGEKLYAKSGTNGNSKITYSPVA